MKRITYIKKEFSSIKEKMEVVKKNNFSWEKKGVIFYWGLSNKILNKPGTGGIQYFTSKLPKFARYVDDLNLDKKYLNIALGLTDEEIDFLIENKEFLKNIPI